MAGASRRYQRAHPSVIARTAARSGTFMKGASAISAVRPSKAIAVIARAASASAVAPGAQRVLFVFNVVPVIRNAARKLGGYERNPWPRKGGGRGTVR